MKGDYTLEIYDQLRPSGRILEHFRAVLGGSKPTTATRFHTGELFIPFFARQISSMLLALQNMLLASQNMLLKPFLLLVL